MIHDDNNVIFHTFLGPPKPLPETTRSSVGIISRLSKYKHDYNGSIWLKRKNQGAPVFATSTNPRFKRSIRRPHTHPVNKSDRNGYLFALFCSAVCYVVVSVTGTSTVKQIWNMPLQLLLNNRLLSYLEDCLANR